MELKRFQIRVLDETLKFLERLASEQADGNKRASLEAWEATRGTIGYRQRRNGLDRDLPDVWIKVPTGGGKTLLATRILGQIYSMIHRDRNGAGLALWVVPSDQIYKQTLGQLRDVSHPYRHSIEQAVGRRVEVWEKHEATRIRPTHLRDALNILMLKLPSANRQDRETLKLFRDSGGNIVQHFPAEDDADAHRALAARVTVDRCPDGIAVRLASGIEASRSRCPLPRGGVADVDRMIDDLGAGCRRQGLAAGAVVRLVPQADREGVVASVALRRHRAVAGAAAVRVLPRTGREYPCARDGAITVACSTGKARDRRGDEQRR
jgi:hypothetical protein